MTCEQCGENKARRTHRRNPLDWAAGLVRVYPHRCSGCEYRFYAGSVREKPARRWNGAGLQFLIYSVVLVGCLALLVVYFKVAD